MQPKPAAVARDAEGLGTSQKQEGPAGSSRFSPAQQAVASRSAKHASSARPAEDLESDQKQEESPGSRRFTPAQQAVAAALMVVLKRALTDGKQSMCSAKRILEMNNPATRLFLQMLPDSGPLPAMKQIEQRSSNQLLQSLAKLAGQCAAAQCQPLEVFTRSLQCDARIAYAERRGVQRGAYDWQQRKKQQRMPMSPSACQEWLVCMLQLGLQQSMADLMIAYEQVLKLYHDDTETAPLTEPDLNHMLPGMFNRLTFTNLYGVPEERLRESDHPGFGILVLPALMRTEHIALHAPLHEEFQWRKQLACSA